MGLEEPDPQTIEDRLAEVAYAPQRTRSMAQKVPRQQ